MSIIIDSVDLRTKGVVASIADRDWPEIRYPLGYVSGPGLMGATHMSTEGIAQERTITVVGAISSSTHALALAAMDELAHRIMRRTVKLQFPDVTTRYYWVRMAGPFHRTVEPAFVQKGWTHSWRFLAVDPRAFDVTPQSIDFTAGATQMPLGNAPSPCSILLVGPCTAPITITMRDSSAAVVGVCTITDDIPAGSTLEIDSWNNRLLLDGSPVNNWLLSGTRFLVLDPLHAVVGGLGGQPTLECSPAPALATCDFPRAWMNA